MPQKQLTRSASDKMIGGVCGGLAEYFGIDSTLVRVITAFLVFFLGLGPLLYIVLWIVMPQGTNFSNPQHPHFNGPQDQYRA